MSFSAAAALGAGVIAIAPLTPAYAADAQSSSVHDLGYYSCELTTTIAEEHISGMLTCSHMDPGVRVRIKAEGPYVTDYSTWMSSAQWQARPDGGVHFGPVPVGDGRKLSIQVDLGDSVKVAPGPVRFTPSRASWMGPIGFNTGAARNGTPITTTQAYAGSTQDWQSYADGTMRSTASSDYCLDIKGGKATQGAPIHLWKCDSGSSEKWYVLLSGVVASYNDPEYCLTARDVTPGTQLTVEKCDGTSAQRFDFT